MADYLTDRIEFEQVGIKDLAVLDSSIFSHMESFDLTTGVWEYTTNFSPYNNFKLTAIKIKSVEQLINEDVKIEVIETNPLFNTILWKRNITLANNVMITAEDRDLVCYRGSQFKISLTNNNTVGNIYVMLYFQVI